MSHFFPSFSLEQIFEINNKTCKMFFFSFVWNGMLLLRIQHVMTRTAVVAAAAAKISLYLTNKTQ